MAIESFCGIITLQVGAAMMSAVFLTVATLVTIVNVFNYDNHPDWNWPASLVILTVFIVLMFISGILMFMAAYNESRRQSLAAFTLIAITLVYWLILCCLSFSNNPDILSAVCIHERCAESFWSINLKYRGKFRNSPNSPMGISFQFDQPVLDTDFKMFHNEKMQMYPEDVKTLKRQYRHTGLNVQYVFNATTAAPATQPRYEFGLPMIGGIFMFVSNFIFYVFSMLIMWGFYKELQNPLYFADFI